MRRRHATLVRRGVHQPKTTISALKRFPIFAACLFVALPALSVAQERVSARRTRTGVTAVNTYAKDIDQFIKRNPKDHRIFGDTASGTQDEPSHWQEFKTEAEREKADTGENLNENAYVWLKGGKVVGVNFTFQSPSRDWAQFAMYYFREDGTLAKIQSRLNTFYGELTVRQEKFYSSEGKLLRTTKKYLDLNSQKPKKPGKDIQEFPIPVYRRVEDLPFYKLL